MNRMIVLAALIGASAVSAEPVDPLRVAAASGDVNAQMQLAEQYASDGTQAGKKTAFGWRLRAARQGHAPAYLLVAQGFHDGLGGIEDVPRALAWYERAAATGQASAQNEVAYHLAIEGLDVKRAHELVDAALAQQPDNPHFLDTKATILEREGRWREAEKLLVRAHGLAPKDADLQKHLWRVDHRLHR